MWMKLGFAAIGLMIIAVAIFYVAFRLSPWPSVIYFRYIFHEGSEKAAASISQLIPAGITARRGLRYDDANPNALFDVFAPTDAKTPLPAVIWVHGGGFIAGSRSDLSSYLQILAARGFVTIAVDYSLAPEVQFPTPLREINEALAHVISNAQGFNIDPTRIFLAGDSAGAQLAAQSALIISDPTYAHWISIAPGMNRRALRGIALFCGRYDARSIKFSNTFLDFPRTMVWSYTGVSDAIDSRVTRLSVTPHVSANLPPVFISAGNADPLAPLSVSLSEALAAKGVEVDSLFFPDDFDPPLHHEYQRLLDSDAGQLAFERLVKFLIVHTK